MKKLAHLEPKEVFRFYEEILCIPHESGNEKALSDYCVKFAKDRGLQVHQDAVNNVLISKPATPGYEDRPAIILQGHLDMVCVADPGVEIDFAKDPIPFYIDGDYIRAHGTTLGSDNAHGVAMALAVLDSDRLKHPPLQVLFTVEEETTFAGAENVDGNLLHGKYYIGLDYVDDQAILVSCGGSSDNIAAFDVTPVALEHPKDYTVLTLELSGAAGGHSALEIHKYGINCIKALGELLCQLNERFSIELIHMEGGTKINAIATWSKARICCITSQFASVKKHVDNFSTSMYQKYRETDPNFNIAVTVEDAPEEMQVLSNKENLLYLLDVHPNGVVTWINPAENIVESSINMGILRTTNNQIILYSLARSNNDYFHDELLRKVKALIKNTGATYRIESKCCSWDYNPNSSLQTQACEIYKKIHGHEPKLDLAHGQVETGAIMQKMKECGKYMEAIGISPESAGAHTTSEDLSIPSMAKTYRFLCTMLEELQ